MKKTTLFTGMMLCLGMLPNGYAATQGTVTFKGEVIAAKLCTVKTGSENQTVDLGYILSSQFINANQAVGTGKGFILSVTDCGAGQNNIGNHLTYYFISNYAEAGTGILKNSDATSGNYNTVGIQLFSKNNNTAIKVLNQQALPEHNRIIGGYTGTQLNAHTNGNAVDINLIAKFYGRTAGSNDKAGKVASEMTFGVWYE